MSIENTVRKTDVMNGNGSTTQFAFNFRINSINDLKVYVKIGSGAYTLQTINNDYEIILDSGDYDTNGNIIKGKIKYPKNGDPLTSSDSIYAIRETPNTQLETSEQVSFQSSDIERALDKATMQLQELAEDVSRSVMLQPWQTTLTPDQLLASIYTAEANASASAISASGSALSASDSASSASTYSTNASKWSEGTDEQVSALGGTHSAKGWAEVAQSSAASSANTSLSNLTSAGEQRVVPAGALIMSPVSSLSGYLLCNGQAVSRTTYSELFALIGTNFGSGDGETTFNVPDYRGCFLRGLGGDSAADMYTKQNSAAPNITGGLEGIGTSSSESFGSATGCITKSTEYSGMQTGNSGYQKRTNIGIDASLSSSLYQNGVTEIRPTNFAINYFIKY